MTLHQRVIWHNCCGTVYTSSDLHV